MNRRQFLAISSAALAAGPFRTLAGAAQGQQPPPQPRFENIRRNVGYFTARGGTIGWLSNKESVVTVDTQYPDTAKLCLDGLRERSGGRNIDVAFNTHHHGDHTGGNPIFKAAAKRLVAHVRVPELQKQFGAPAGAQNAPAPVLADTTFDTTWSETFGDERVHAKHYGPGHTGGDAVIVFERAQVVHMGDLYFHEVHPRVDRPAGASIQNWMKTIDAVTKEMPADTIFIAGHARPGLAVTSGSKELLRLRDYFDAALTHVRQSVAKGQSKENIMTLKALPGFESHQSLGTILTLEGVLGVAYDEITAK
jgi:glyoxylase-like metal-dependent hydrolase (beta-lactamase superfamily II)